MKLSREGESKTGCEGGVKMAISEADNTGQEIIPIVLLRTLKIASILGSPTSRGDSVQGLVHAPASFSDLYGPDQQFDTFRAWKK